jgi:hypothetical protein
MGPLKSSTFSRGISTPRSPRATIIPSLTANILSKLLHCVQRADGKPRWSFSTRGKVDSSPVVCGGKVGARASRSRPAR